MKKVIILGIVSALLAVIAYYMLFTVSPESRLIQEQGSTVTEEASDKEVVVEAPKGTGTLESLRLLNEDLECTILFTPSTQTAAVEGTYFVSDGNIRGDFLTESPDLSGQILSSIIIEGETMYTWSEIEGKAYGMKMDLTTVDGVTADETKQPVSLNEDVRYDCKNWENVDRTVFVPPSDVLFQDMSELMKAGMEEATIYEEEGELPF